MSLLTIIALLDSVLSMHSLVKNRICNKDNDDDEFAWY